MRLLRFYLCNPSQSKTYNTITSTITAADMFFIVMAYKTLADSLQINVNIITKINENSGRELIVVK